VNILSSIAAVACGVLLLIAIVCLIGYVALGALTVDWRKR
jgi:hypothetical protein